jgi:ArsR family transcriptional regulator
MNPESVFKALSGEIRLRCLMLLIGHDELCVCELIHALGLPQPKISHHLAALRRAKLVADRKQGLWIYYRIHPDIPDWVQDVIYAAQSGAVNHEPYITDARSLATMPNRPGSTCCA